MRDFTYEGINIFSSKLLEHIARCYEYTHCEYYDDCIKCPNMKLCVSISDLEKAAINVRNNLLERYI